VLVAGQMAATVGDFQINIAPTLSVFPRALEQVRFYQQYRIRKIAYDILPVKNVNAVDENLVYLYDVPIIGN